MTVEYAPAVLAAADNQPEAGTPVLLNRPIRPGTDPAVLSVFGDDRWELTPALFEEHVAATSLNFATIPAALRTTAKNYVWQLLNCPDPPALRRFSSTRLSVRTVVNGFPSLTSFLVWLDVRGITTLPGVGPADLDSYLSDLLHSGLSRDTLGDRITAVRRLWAWRERLPAGDRLPAAPPWRGEDSDATTRQTRPRRGSRPRPSAPRPPAQLPHPLAGPPSERRGPGHQRSAHRRCRLSERPGHRPPRWRPLAAAPDHLQ